MDPTRCGLLWVTPTCTVTFQVPFTFNRLNTTTTTSSTNSYPPQLLIPCIYHRQPPPQLPRRRTSLFRPKPETTSTAEMAKRVVASSLGIHRKKKQLKKQPTSRKRRFLRKALRYLCSDTFMYAPLAAAAASSDDGFITTTAAAATTSASLPPLFPTGEGKKKLISKVGDYLKSDCFMYAPLTNHYTQTPHPPPQGPTRLDKRSPSKEIDQSTERHVTKGDKVNDNPRYRSTRFQQTREHHKTGNYIVQQNCQPIPGEGIL